MIPKDTKKLEKNVADVLQKAAADLPVDKKTKRKLKTRAPFILAMIFVFFSSLGQYFPIFYLQLFAELHGVNVTASFYSNAVLSATNLVGRVLVNYTADIFGVVNVYIVIQTILGTFQCTRKI